jgi:hypothetical protein
MLTNKILTPIDDFISFIKKNPNSEIYEIAKSLNFSVKVVERWVLILEEEEKIQVKVENFKSYVSYKSKTKIEFDFSKLKNSFLQKAKQRKIPYFEILNLWKNYIEENEENLKLYYKKDKKIINKKSWKIFKLELEAL